MSRIRVAMDQYGEVFEDDRKAASDLRACVASLQALDGEQVRGELRHHFEVKRRG
jgi:hypothetical protein